MSFWSKSATACTVSGSARSPLGRPGVRSSAAIGGTCSIGFMGSSNPALNQTPCMNSSQPERSQPKSANIEITLTCVHLDMKRLGTCQLSGEKSLFHCFRFQKADQTRGEEMPHPQKNQQ